MPRNRRAMIEAITPRGEPGTVAAPPEATLDGVGLALATEDGAGLAALAPALCDAAGLADAPGRPVPAGASCTASTRTTALMSTSSAGMVTARLRVSSGRARRSARMSGGSDASGKARSALGRAGRPPAGRPVSRDPVGRAALLRRPAGRA